MKKTIKNHISVFCVVSLFFSLTFFSSLGSAREIGGSGPTTQARPNIQIEGLEAFDASWCYEIHLVIHNYEGYDIPGEVVHMLFKPDGTKEILMTWDYVFTERLLVFYSIFYGYPGELYGEYTYKVILKTDNGCILDQESVTWERVKPL